jgi:hypothetical protein
LGGRPGADDQSSEEGSPISSKAGGHDAGYNVGEDGDGVPGGGRRSKGGWSSEHSGQGREGYLGWTDASWGKKQG